MKRVAFYTLGCKVNQYDTQAMLEAFTSRGYEAVDFESPADVYVINTCTVTGTGDQKSLKAIRRAARQSPGAAIVVCGCLAQRDAHAVALPGVMLVLGTQRRAQVAELLERALAGGRPLIAVDALESAEFEPLQVRAHAEKTRAVLKIQEGCDRHCAYCIIPSVRGPVRSMPLDEVARQGRMLAQAGYREVVVNGIHLASYGRGSGHTLVDAMAALSGIPGIARIRLGSLEPLTVDDAFLRALRDMPKVCPQFHLSLQSGSADVLRAMRRTYSPQQYARAVHALRAARPLCAITTDVLCGFPGETDQQARDTLRFIEELGLARLHVFPYSQREGTAAATLPNQVPEATKRARAAQLISLGQRLECDFAQALVGTVQQVLFEEEQDGLAEGYTGQYVRVRAPGRAGELVDVRITGACEQGGVRGERA